MGSQPTQTLAASATRTTSGVSGAIRISDSSRVAVQVNVTASSGTTPTLDLTLEWSNNAGTFAPGDPADAFTTITGNGNKVKSFAVQGEYVRLAWAVAGTTPSFTFNATAYGV